jgi:hypothetical protein
MESEWFAAMEARARAVREASAAPGEGGVPAPEAVSEDDAVVNAAEPFLVHEQGEAISLPPPAAGEGREGARATRADHLTDAPAVPRTREREPGRCPSIGVGPDATPFACEEMPEG